MMPYAEITWNGIILELLSEKEECRIQGRRLQPQTAIKSCSRTLEAALEGPSRSDLVQVSVFRLLPRDMGQLVLSLSSSPRL